MSSMVFLEVDKEDEKRIRDAYPESVILSKPLQEEDGFEQCKDAEVISCFIYSKFQKEDLDKLPNLKLLCSRSVGYDHIDLNECKKRGIVVSNVPDYGSYVIAEHVFALLLGTLRHIHEADKRVEAGAFDYHGLRGKTLRGKTIGIVGTGKIGRRVAQIAHGFGMRIIAVDRCRTVELEDLLGVRYMLFEDMIKEADVISLHLPLVDQTKHIINKETFEQMKKGVIIVNTARGGLVDSDALLEALKSGKVSYALLDVMEHEKDFDANKELIGHPNAITTPHIAFYADDSMQNMYEDCFQSIEEWKRGEEPVHAVHPPEIICDLPAVGKK